MLAAGCDQRDIRVYRVPKEPPPWILPAGWSEEEPTRLSLANFVVQGKDGKSAEISVVPLNGIVTQDAELVNVARDRFKLPALSAEEVKRQTERVDIGPAKGSLFDMAADASGTGAESTRLILATVTRDNTSWFFRMSGDDALVREQKAAFVQFLK